MVDGRDPAGERLAAREAARTGETFADLAEAYWPAAERGLHGGRRRPMTPGVIRAERSRYRLHLEPKLGRRRFTELTRRDIRMFMRELAATSGMSPHGVASVGTLLSSILAFAVFEDRIEFNPATGPRSSVTGAYVRRSIAALARHQGCPLRRQVAARGVSNAVRSSDRRTADGRLAPQLAPLHLRIRSRRPERRLRVISGRE